MAHYLNSLFTQLTEQGGFSYQISTGTSPKAGDHLFAVAYSKTTEAKFELASFTVANLIDYIQAHFADLQFDNVHLGGWVDNGIIYLDCSLVTDSEEAAIEIATEAEQLAYFSFETMETKESHRMSEAA